MFFCLIFDFWRKKTHLWFDSWRPWEWGPRRAACSWSRSRRPKCRTRRRLSRSSTLSPQVLRGRASWKILTALFSRIFWASFKNFQAFFSHPPRLSCKCLIPFGIFGLHLKDFDLCYRGANFCLSIMRYDVPCLDSPKSVIFTTLSLVIKQLRAAMSLKNNKKTNSDNLFL